MHADEPSIVIIEDDPFISLSNQYMCEDLGMRVVGVCDNADDGIHAILTHNPDYVLLDVRLKGDRDGVAIANEVMRQGFRGGIIYATGSNDPGTIARLQATNPLDILVKPIVDSQFSSTIRV
ncbi:response regulator [Acuticoccus mangrovi]|uniref:Response regulator n=1 Tax=Acuticoccus mangrovi TaxID=2796142 RepID=A0A934MFG4_9HYPH|nr:response regulator [Acuticoccus mangrovi]MBJ3775438.1 response regulator [Acuticoccus mangrovi]